MGKQTIRGQIVERYCDSDKKSADKQLAKQIILENKNIFGELTDKNIEAIRSHVRAYRGKIGTLSNKRINKSERKPFDYKPYVKEILQKRANETQAKILVLDIETAPLRAYTWGVWNQNIDHKQVISDFFILCWSAKWLFDDKVTSGVLTKAELTEENDKRIMKQMWRLLEQADIVITHNGDRFDLPKLNTRFLIHGIKQPMPYQSIDTLKVAKKRFAFTNNRLDNICRQLGLDRKTDTGGWELWQKCSEHHHPSLKKMAAYCDNDVKILEEVYLAIRGWITSHPNMGMYIEDNLSCCPNCSSIDIVDTSGAYRTQVGEFSAFRCNDCGAIGRHRKNAFTGNKKLTVSISR